MKVLSIGSDRKVFEKGSAVRSRLLEYGELADELHVIVFAKRSSGFRDETISPNIFLYPTNSLGKFFHVPAAIIRAVILKRQGVTIDVVTTQDPFEAGLVGYFVARIFSARLHIQIHTDFLSPYFARESLLNRARVTIAKFLIPKAGALRVVSERIKDSLFINGYKLPSTTILPIFVKVQQNKKITPSENLREKYPQFDFRILVASRFSREKNIQSVINTMRLVVDAHPKTGLIIVGGGPEESQLKKLVAKLGLEENVVFEGWQSDLFAYYKTADVFVFPSYYEGYGMTVVESLAAGCPVIMTDVGCAGTVVRDKKNGLIAPVGDTPALAYAIERVVSGKVKFDVTAPKLTTKEEYLTAYRKSWEDALV